MKIINKLIKSFKFLPLSFGVFALVACANILPSQLHISSDVMQEKLEEQFPRQNTVMSMYQINLSNPKLNLDEKNKRIRISLTTQINSPLMQAISGDVTFSSNVELDSEKKNLLLKDPMVENLEFKELNPNTKEFMLPALKIAVGSLLSGYPIYKIKPEQFKLLGTQIQPTDIQIKDDGIDIKIKSD